MGNRCSAWRHQWDDLPFKTPVDLEFPFVQGKQAAIPFQLEHAIEKPARGDFLPILDGGYGLQYSPLIEYHEGKGGVLFCQMDVTGRTEIDPAADTLARNITRYISDWTPARNRNAIYVGDPAGRSYLESAGIALDAYEGGKVSLDQVLVVGPQSGQKLAPNKTIIAEWLRAGGNLLAIGLEEQDANAFLPFQVGTSSAKYSPQ